QSARCGFEAGIRRAFAAARADVDVQRVIELAHLVGVSPALFTRGERELDALDGAGGGNDDLVNAAMTAGGLIRQTARPAEAQLRVRDGCRRGAEEVRVDTVRRVEHLALQLRFEPRREREIVREHCAWQR